MIETPPPWYQQTPDSVLKALSSAPEGLSAQEACRRLAEFGPNQLPEAAPTNLWAILWAQFDSFMVQLLLGAALVSALLGEMVDAIAILAIVLLNAGIGFVQEYRAERALAALKAMTAPQAKVRRANQVMSVAVHELVPGDVMVLEAGDVVPADGRLIRADRVKAVEGVLTGESLPVTKHVEPIPEEVPLGDQHNLLFMGTYVADGTAEGVVTATGSATEMGRIAHLIGEASRNQVTPLQARLQQLGRVLVWAALGIVLLIFGIGLLEGVPLFSLFLASVSLAVAAVPEGLPAVVTVALAVGVQRMAHRRALIRKLASVETLGATSVIATDKTGTLTVGQMTVREVAVAGEKVAISGEGYGPVGTWQTDLPDDLLRDVARVWAASSNARLIEKQGQWQVIGDPTEGALLAMSAKAGVHVDDLEQAWPRERELPFDSERKRMSVVRRHPEGGLVIFSKGAPEVLVPRCSHYLSREGVAPLTDAVKSQLRDVEHRMADRALRVMAAAYRPLDRMPEGDEAENQLILVGLAGMYDPPREEAKVSIRRCREAGVRVVMITGDHPATARAVAEELGLLDPGQEVCAGKELAALGEGELTERVPQIGVYARVTAQDKLRIVRAWQSRGEVVAMTGDGVNDAPAIKAADVGIAMGITGTDVTKEASDMVIADDNFASIVAAVEEGRGVYDNIQKTLLYLLAGNTGELLFILMCLVAVLPFPLLPVHLLWINLVTDGLPAIALATDPKDPDAMRRAPRGREEAMLDRSFWGWTLLAGLLTAMAALAAYFWALDRFSFSHAMTLAFATLVYAELLKSLAMRHLTKPLIRVGIFSNPKLLAVVGLSFFLQPWLFQVDALQTVFRVEPLTWDQIGVALLLGSVPFWGLELAKLLRR